MPDHIARWPSRWCSRARAWGDNPLTVFADPGKYQYYSCEQIAEKRKDAAAKEQGLQMLMDKADQGAGGVIVNLLVYKADHVAASEELKVLDTTARAKNCEKRPTSAAIPR